MFKNLAFRQVPLYCGCDGGSGGDANCGCGGSSGGGGDSDGDGLNDAFDSTPNGGYDASSDADVNMDSAEYTDNPEGSFSTGYGNFSDNDQSVETAYDYARDPDVNMVGREHSRIGNSYTMADELTEENNYQNAGLLDQIEMNPLRTVVPTLLGFVNPIAGIASKGLLAHAAYENPEVQGLAVNNDVRDSVLGMAANIITGMSGLGKAAHDVAGIPGAIAASSAVKSGVNALASVTPSSPASMADQTIDATGESTADETLQQIASVTDQTLQQIASVTDQNDPYADAGFGNYRNRQIRSRVRRPLLRG